MTSKTLLVTGGAGFIGSNFIRYIFEKRPTWRIVNLDLLTYAGNLNNLEDVTTAAGIQYDFVHGDIGDLAILNRLFEQYRFDGVVHFAAESHVDRSILGPEAFIQTNVMGTYRLIQSCLDHWRQSGQANDFRFLHVSTDEVYGSLGETGYFTEKTPYDPSSPYSASKASSDHLVRAYYRTYGLPTIITNCSNNFGPYQFPEKLIPLMIINIYENKPLPVYGDGKNIRDWLYVIDHCEALLTVLEKGVPGETYNIGGNAERRNIDIVHQICRLMDQRTGQSDSQPSSDLIQFVKDRPGHDRRYAIDSTKIHSELGWAPRHGFEVALKATVEWYLDNLQWVASVRSGDYRKWIDLNYANRPSTHTGA